MEQRMQTETFSRDDREIARARRVVARTLHDWGMDVAAPVMKIMVSELVTNALVHGDGAVGLLLTSDGQLVRLEVTDGGGTPTTPHLVEHTHLGGWGLRLVDRLADRWGTDHDDHATLVWTEMRAREPSPTSR